MKSLYTNIVKYLEVDKRIDFALLFGSYANKTNTFLSDIDIAIYTTQDLDLLEMGLLISDLEEISGKKVDLVLVNNLYKTDAKFAFNIIQNHELLFYHDKEKYSDFKSNVMQFYFDIKPMYNMFDKALKQRLQSGTYGKI